LSFLKCSLALRRQMQLSRGTIAKAISEALQMQKKIQNNVMHDNVSELE